MSDDMITMLIDQVGRLFADAIDRKVLTAVEQGQSCASLCAAIESFGLADALTMDLENGGISFADAGALFALTGFHAVPVPLGEAMLARGILARAGIEAPAGDIALADTAAASASFAPHVLVESGDAVELRVGGTLSPSGIARLPRQAIAAGDGAAVARFAMPAGLPDLATLGAMLRASQIAGAIARLLDLCVTYANERKQFGKPIGRFQAIQQQLAVLAAEAAAARAAADAAWSALDREMLGMLGAVAKIRAGQAARNACAIAHQVHGAIGVTDEHFLHYVTRRLWEWRLDFGSEGVWATALGRAARNADGGLWQFLSQGCPAPAVTRETA